MLRCSNQLGYQAMSSTRPQSELGTDTPIGTFFFVSCDVFFK